MNIQTAATITAALVIAALGARGGYIMAENSAARDVRACAAGLKEQDLMAWPRVAALEYSVARASKKLACSTPDNRACSQGSGFSVTP